VSNEIDQLAQLVAQTRLQDIPVEVRDHARLVLLDTVGVILGGAGQPEVERLRATMAGSAGSGATIYAPGWPVTDPARAAFLNAVAGRAIEMCETHLTVSCQAAVQIVPGALAVAEATGRSGAELLTAFIVGYEVAMRIGAATRRRPMAHPLGQAGMLGAIAAGARLRGLDAATTARAIRIGGNLMVTASYGNVLAGATTINASGGMSAMAAAIAPELALAGFTAMDDAIGHTMTELLGEAYDPAIVRTGLGTPWAIRDSHFRLRACCNPIYPALDALEDALDQMQPDAAQIERIEVATYAFAANMAEKHPPNHFGARYSLPHAAAALCVNRHLRYASFTEQAVHDPAIAALRQRVQLTEDARLSAKQPRLKPARVTLVLTDGRQVTVERDDDRRAGQVIDPAQVRGKFRELAALVLTDAGVTAVEAAIDQCEQWPDMLSLMQALRR